MTLTSKPLALLVIVILFGGILFSSAMGWWLTTSSKIAATYAEGEYAGQANPADIRGSYTLGDVEKNFGVPAAVVAKAFAVQSSDPETYQIKNLETQYADSPVEIGTASVRLFVAFYLGLPFDLGADIYLPETAVTLLQERSLSAEQAAYLETHNAAQPGAEASPPAPGATQPAASTLESPADRGAETTPAAPAATEHVSTYSATDRLVKGRTTFGELLSWGVTQADIEKILGMSMPAEPAATVKDFCTAQGLSFETIKPALQTAVDAAK
jgi:hypothetical protein